jgi:hypothetical protein
MVGSVWFGMVEDGWLVWLVRFGLVWLRMVGWYGWFGLVWYGLVNAAASTIYELTIYISVMIHLYDTYIEYMYMYMIYLYRYL